MHDEEMVTIASPDGAVSQLDIQSTGERFIARNGGMYDVPARLAPLVRELGGFVPNIGPMILKGGRCGGCGFASYFVRCSRCGTDRRGDPREAPIAIRPQDLAPAARKVVFGTDARYPSALTVRQIGAQIAT